MPSRVFFQSKKINSDYTLLLFPFYCKEHFKQQILSCMQIIVGNINNVTLNLWTNPSVITQHSDLRHQSNNIYNIKIYNHNNLSYNIQFKTQVLIYFFPSLAYEYTTYLDAVDDDVKCRQRPTENHSLRSSFSLGHEFTRLFLGPLCQRQV